MYLYLHLVYRQFLYMYNSKLYFIRQSYPFGSQIFAYKICIHALYVLTSYLKSGRCKIQCFQSSERSSKNKDQIFNAHLFTLEPRGRLDILLRYFSSCHLSDFHFSVGKMFEKNLYCKLLLISSV